jgi:phosphoglycolate phosphatase-like HAD superfamily hydrolase
MHVRCVIFDIDGVLIDTSGMVKAGQKSVACRLGIRRSDEEDVFFEVWRNLAIVLGTTISEFFLDCVVKECRMNGLLLENDTQLHEVFQSGYWSDVRATPHANHLIEWLKSSNIKIGILSDGAASSQLRKLQLAGLWRLFESSSISIQDPTSKYSKPNPAKLLGLVSSMGVNADDAAYVGDRESDVLVAKLSGCCAVRLADGREHPNVNAGLQAVRGAAGNSLHLTTADLTIDSLEDFMRWLL